VPACFCKSCGWLGGSRLNCTHYPRFTLGSNLAASFCDVFVTLVAEPPTVYAITPQDRALENIDKLLTDGGQNYERSIISRPLRRFEVFKKHNQLRNGLSAWCAVPCTNSIVLVAGRRR
jgi:hypothetical protein